MFRVTADSNIYVSAFQFRGTPLKLLTLASERKIDLAISDHIVEEVTRTLRQKFDSPEDRIVEAQRIMGRIARRVVPSRSLSVIKEDPTTTASWNAPLKPSRITSSPGIRTFTGSDTTGMPASSRPLTCWTWYWGKVGGVESSDECQVRSPISGRQKRQVKEPAPYADEDDLTPGNRRTCRLVIIGDCEDDGGVFRH